MKSFVVHLRVTKDCNADCSYCCSENNEKVSYMDTHEAVSSFLWLIDNYIPRNVDRITVEYLGGEITLLPIDKLSDIVNTIRNIGAERGIEIYDGLQTNLTLPKKRLEAYISLFKGRIGTSIDNFTKQRTIKGRHTDYNERFKENLIFFENKLEKVIPAVVVIDGKSIKFATQELKLAENDGRSLGFRPVFEGSSVIDKSFTVEELRDCHMELFEQWFLKSKIIVEPFYTLFKRRIGTMLGYKPYNFCAWQSNCVQNSVAVEPNGDLYVCQNLADMKYGKLGNAQDMTFDRKAYNEIGRRVSHIARQCGQCAYYQDCQGGCMITSIATHGNVKEKTEYCMVWFSLFEAMTKAIDDLGAAKIGKWLDSLK